MTKFPSSDAKSMTQSQLIELGERVMLRNYRQPPVVIDRGEGVELWDVAGRRFLDMTAGISVCALGHNHPALTSAIREQAGKLLQASNLVYNAPNILAAAAVTETSFADRVYFCNSGGEANEAALKLVRRYMHVVAGTPERNLLVSTHGSFHGRTFATLSVTGQEKYRADFGPLVEPVMMVPFGDLDAAAAVLRKRTAACFIVEPIQAEGGIIVPPDGYLAGLRALCDETDTLLVFDEIQTGMGRTGKWFGHQWDDVVPDVMTLAKALGGGVPIGAMACSEKAAQGLNFVAGSVVPHASTFGGNPLACAASVAVFETIERDGLLANCVEVGAYLGERLVELVARHPDKAVETRGRGFLRGVVLKEPAGPTVAACRDRGTLFSVAGGTVVRFAPPLIATRDNIDEAVAVLDQALGA